MTPADQIYSLPTNTGAAKLSYAMANNLTVQISHMAIGDGNGAVVNPTAAAIGLVREVHRAQLNQLYQHPESPNWLVAELVIPAEVGGWTIREIGLYDVDGDLIFVGNHAEQYKPVQSQGSDETKTIRMVILVSSVAAVTLKTDPATVMATIKFVNDSIATAATEATQEEAEAGTNSTRKMTPRRVWQAITKRFATQLQAEAGTDNATIMTPLRVTQLLGKRADSFGYMGGLTLSNNAATPSTDIDIVPGAARSSDNSVSLLLAAPLTKRLQSAGGWSAGSAGGGLFSGARTANTWYHVFLIRRDSDGTVDAGFDTSATAANRPAGYTACRRIGSIKTDAGGNILSFVQHGRRFYWATPVGDVAVLSLAAGASATYVITTPPGLRTVAMLQYNIQGGNAHAYIRCPDLVEVTPTSTNYLGYGAVSNASPEGGAGYLEVLTNVSSQIGATANNSALISLHINALGWIDQ